MEIWKPVKNYEDLYLVSNRGRVKSLPRLVWRHHPRTLTRFQQPVKEKILRPAKNKQTGYLHVHLQKNGTGESFYVHRLVAEAFLPNPENKREVNHKNLDKTNNHKKNLEWRTSSGNKKHAVNNGVEYYKKYRVLRKEDVLQIHKMYKEESYTQKQIADKFGCHPTHISNILSRRKWKNTQN